ncbi:MAG: aromatic ring-hydroxylating dioxygenase subunit alpha [Rhodospirillales bacterium]
MSEVSAVQFGPFWSGTTPRAGLPSSAYCDEEFWNAECATVFTDNWVCAGFAHEIPRAGDAFPTTVAGQPIVLVRDHDNQIGAFHNVCRHRCLKLVDEARNVGKLIRCPYHAWAYDLKGALRAFPSFGGPGDAKAEGFEPAAHGLVPVRCHVWHDWIFVNVGGKAPDFDAYAASLQARLSDVDLTHLMPLTTLDFGIVETNWKFIMENFIEPYHVQFVHRGTTDQPLDKHATFIDGNCLGSTVDLDAENTGTSSLAVSSRYLTLFPNFILGTYFPNQIGVYLNVPLGPGRTAQKRAIYQTHGERPDAVGIEALGKLWWNVHKEDHAICERMQQGRASVVARDGGVLSSCWEDSVRAFQELVAVNTSAGAPASHR